MTKKHEDYSRTRTFGRTDRRDIPLENDAMFSTVMQYEDACRGLIETIFEGRKVRRLQYKDMQPASQKNIIFDPANKSIRLDVFFEDGDTVYDIEMQKVDTGNLPLRARMYSSMMDATCWTKGWSTRPSEGAMSSSYACSTFSKGVARNTRSNPYAKRIGTCRLGTAVVSCS